MAANYGLKVDLSELLAQHESIIDEVYPLISQAVHYVAKHAASQWRDAVWQAHLWEGEKKPYFESISTMMTSKFEAEVSSDYQHADEIDEGRPARDLKRMLQTSRKTRLSHSKAHPGQKYLIIPFRHNTPGNEAHAAAMPQEIYERAKRLAPSHLLKLGTKKPATRLSASHNLVLQHSYDWGGRLPAGLAPKAKEHHATDLYAGMVKFNTSSAKAKSSAYLTFRIMGEWQNDPKWVVQPRPGLRIIKKVADDIEPILEAALSKAVSSIK